MVIIFLLFCACFLFSFEIIIYNFMIKDTKHSQYNMLYWSILYNYGSKYSEIKSLFKIGCFDKCLYKEKIKLIKTKRKLEIKELKNEYKKIG